MRLFISYGHPQADICCRIRDVLEKRGHQVWFDKTNIPHGADWREKIVDGIQTSEGVLSMIDRHSVRDPGVCLDEMSIAIGVRGGNIRYVLLEEESVSNPPASMTTRQWLDMSDWREHENDSAWFNNKMAALVRMIESPENMEFARLIDQIRKQLPSCHVSTAKQDSLLRHPFIGRAWMKDQVELWLNRQNGSKICFVYGDPGIGKSAFAAHYTHYNGRVAAAFFCDYGNTKFNHPRDVIQTLAFLLACRLPDYRLSLAETLDHSDDLGKYNESELFDLLLAQPLTTGTIDGNRETMCILIDGLDESGDRDRNILTEVLTRYADRLPRWLRILVFSRRVETVTGLSGGSDTIELTGGLEENKADIRAYFEDCLFEQFGAEENYAYLISRLTENSGGIFLYATLMVNAIAEKKMNINDIDSVPEGLNSAFKQWFLWFFPNIREYEENWQMPLACIAGSPEPIPEEELRAVFGWSNTKLNELKVTLEVLLRRDVNDFGKKTLQLNHKYISEWLFSKAAGRFRVDREDAFRKMGETFLEKFKYDPEPLSAYEAYYIWEYVDTYADSLSRRKNKDLLLDGRLHKLIVKYGDDARTWSKYDTAMRYYKMSEKLVLSEDTEKDRLGKSIRKAISLNQEGIVWEKFCQYKEAMALYQEGRELSERVVSERGTLDDLQNLLISYVHVADIYKKQSRFKDALDLYQKGQAIAERIASERGTLDDLFNLSAIYERLAGFDEEQSKFEDALLKYLKVQEIRERINSERGTLDDLRNLFTSYDRLAGIYEKQSCFFDAYLMHQKGLSITNMIASKRGTLDDLRNLSISYDRLAGFDEKQSEFEDALLKYQKALELREKIVSERGTFSDMRDLCVSYISVAGIYKKLGQFDDAQQFSSKADEMAALLKRSS